MALLEDGSYEIGNDTSSQSCKQCGAQLLMQARFCPQCGTSLRVTSLPQGVSNPYIFGLTEKPAIYPAGISVFCSYARADKILRDRLEEHLSILKYRGLITTWYDGEIRSGEEWEHQIIVHLDTAQIILLLVSPRFVASKYCYGVEMMRAMERHERKEAYVVPILLRPVLFTGAPFAKLQMLPTNAKPVTSWRERDRAFFDVAQSIERVAQRYHSISTHYSIRTGWDNFETLKSRPFSGSLLLSVGMFLLGLGIWIVISFLPQSVLPLVVILFLYCLITIVVFITLIRIIYTLITALIRIIHRILRTGWVLRMSGLDFQAFHKERQFQWYYERALAACERALRFSPNDSNAQVSKGDALFALHRYDEALIAYQEAVDCEASAKAYFGLGETFLKLQRYDEARAAYERAIASDFTFAPAYEGMKEMLQLLHREQGVQKILKLMRQQGYEEVES